MAVEHVLSTPITNEAATPAVANTTGQGAAGPLREVSAYTVALASSSQNSTYRFVRVPTNAKIKSVKFASEAQAAGTIDIGVYYPTIGKTAKADLAANAIERNYFADAIALTSASVLTEVLGDGGSGWVPSEINTPLWQALGLSSDPGGFFDIVGTVNTAITTGTGDMCLSVGYVL